MQRLVVRRDATVAQVRAAATEAFALDTSRCLVVLLAGSGHPLLDAGKAGAAMRLCDYPQLKRAVAVRVFVSAVRFRATPATPPAAARGGRRRA
jgi:hypothetical protein